MKIIFVTLILLSCLAGCHSNTNAKRKISDINDTCSIEQKLSAYVIPLENNNSFSFFDKLVKDKKLIILGEAAHNDGVTFETKVNMIKYLNKKHGFDVIGIEGSFFPLEYDFSKPLKYNVTNLNGVGAKEFLPLFEMAHSGQIILKGVDVSARINSSYFMRIFEKYNLLEEIRSFDFDELERKSIKNFRAFTLLEDTVRLEFLVSYMDDINYLKNYLEKLFCDSKWSKNYDLQEIYQVLKSMKGGLRYYIAGSNPTVSDSYGIAYGNNARDQAMADNVLWYIKHNPKKKIILWFANFHGIRDISQAVNSRDSTSYLRTQVMGTYLSEVLGDQMYSIAFTSRKHSEQGILEEEISKTAIPFGFVDFTSLRHLPEFFNRSFNCSAIRKKDGKWLYMWDGLYYIREQKASTPLTD